MSNRILQENGSAIKLESGDMTLLELRTKADSVLNTIWTALANRQEQYRTKNNKYFQLLASAVVVDGVDTVLEISHPSDEAYLSDVQFSFGSPVPFQIRVDEFGDDGALGFSARAIIELPNGNRYYKQRTLVDTRKRVRDAVTTVDGVVTEWGAWYLVGEDPVIQTTPWTQITEE